MVETLNITEVSIEKVSSRILLQQCFVAARILPMIRQAWKLTKGKERESSEGRQGRVGGDSFAYPRHLIVDRSNCFCPRL